LNLNSLSGNFDVYQKISQLEDYGTQGRYNWRQAAKRLSLIQSEQ
jgi:hypothetical protein